MAIPRAMNPQDDFSAGELDSEFMRSDEPIAKVGARQMSNFRLLNSRKPANRPGRLARYLQDGRVDQVLVGPGVVYDLCFTGDGNLVIRDSTGGVVVSNAPFTYQWTTATVNQIVWTLIKTGASSRDVVICFPNSGIKIASFNGTAWTLSNFNFQIGDDGIALYPFFRIAKPNITMVTNITAAAGAAVNVGFSDDVLLATHLGSVFRLAGARLLITAVTNPRAGVATALDQMFSSFSVDVTPTAAANSHSYQIGQLVEGSVSGTKGIVSAIAGTSNLAIQTIFYAPGFVVGEKLVSTSAALAISAVTIVGVPNPVTVWDEQIISDARGWPQSCSTDQNRLIFCDIPGVPEAIIWSASGQPYNCNVGANPTDAMVEIIAGTPRIYHVAPTDGGEIVLTDRATHFIPINETNPLKPGSVAFRHVSPDACSSVRPVRTSEGLLFVNAGRNRIMAVIGSGATYSVKPFVTQDITESHTHLFTSVKAMALTTGDGQFAERYVYVLNADGSIAVGKFDPTKPAVGWLPWSGVGTPNWLSSLQSTLTFTISYPTSGVPISIVEQLDASQYVDAALFINGANPRFTPAPGLGPLWWMPGASVDLIDGVRALGTHVVDAGGFITPIYEGEDLTSATLVAGLKWTATLQPFVFNTPGGEDHEQRMRRRKIVRAAAAVKNSTGYVMAGRRIPAYFVGDTQALPPPLREHVETFRVNGRSFDPVVQLIKDVPGPLTVVELGMEITV